MSLSEILNALSENLPLSRQMSVTAWAADQEMMGQKVALFRQYKDGDHRSFLTPEMRRLLRLTNANFPNGGANTMTEFNDNYCDVVVQTLADRLQVTTIEATAVKESETEKLQVWVDSVLESNRFDGMQMDTHDSTITDGNTYVMVSWDNPTDRYPEGRVCFTLEPAYDGDQGMIVLYREPGQLAAALKIWNVTSVGGQTADSKRINIYYPDRVEKFIAKEGGTPAPYIDDGKRENVEKYVTVDGKPIGIPVVPFRNRRSKYHDFGISELENAIPLQDALNRNLISVVMATELTAFQIRWAKGMKPPADVTPGMWVYFNLPDPTADAIEWLKAVEFGTLEQGDVTPLLDAARWLKQEISNTTRTPAPEFMGADDSSGEALKQRESGLIGKARRFHISGGNSWEDVIMLAHKVQTAFGKTKPPAYQRFYTRWRDPEIRNEKDEIELALKAADRIGEEKFLEIFGKRYEWDADTVQDIIDANQKRSAEKFEQAQQQFNAFPQAKNGNGAGIENGLARRTSEVSAMSIY